MHAAVATEKSVAFFHLLVHVLRDVRAQESLEILPLPEQSQTHVHSVLRAFDCWVPPSSDPCPP